MTAVDERRRRRLGPDADDADARGEHRYPGDREAGGAAEAADEALTREPDQYVAGADGTQPITAGDEES